MALFSFNLDPKSTQAEKLPEIDPVKLTQYQRPADSRIVARSTPEGKREFYFPGGRNSEPVFWIGMILVFALVLAGFARDSFVSWGALAMGVIQVYLLLRLLFGTTAVTVGAGEMEICERLLGVVWRTTTIPASDVVEFKTVEGGSIRGTGLAQGRNRIYYDIQVICQDGEAKAGTMMADSMEAESLAAEMCGYLRGGNATLPETG